MGKKQRRKQQPQRAIVQPPAAASEGPVLQGPVTATAVRPTPAVSPAARSRPASTWLEFRDRYSYVNAELKRIGILAGSFLLVLLVLTAILG